MPFSVQEDDARGPTSAARRTVLLVAEIGLVRTALKQLLTDADEVVVVGEGAPGQALGLARRLTPDLAVIDAIRIDEEFLGLLARLESASPRTRSIILSDDGFGGGLVRVAAVGAWGFLPRDISETELRRAVRLVADGSAVVDCALPPAQFTSLRLLGDREPAHAFSLSARESTVIRAMAQGQTDGQIAEALSISVPTTKTHVRSILRKTGSRNRAAAIAAAFRSGMLR